MYLNGDPDHSQHLMGFNLGQDTSSHIFLKIYPVVYLCNPVSKHTDKRP